MAGDLTSNLKTLSRLFATCSVPTDQIAFYNHPSFLAAEGADSAFLEFHGAWIRGRPRDPAYDAHVRRIVPRMVGASAADYVRSPDNTRQRHGLRLG